MRFRFRLALVFLLLSAFPLTLLAFYSFTTSSSALRRAAEAEAKLMARELEQRVESVSTEIDQSVKALARLPATYWLPAEAGQPENGGSGEARIDPQVLAGLALALPFIEDFRFVPKATSGEAGVVGMRLRLAEHSVRNALLQLPANLPEADRQQIQDKLARVRAEVRRTFAARRDGQPTPLPAPLPAPLPLPAVPPTPPRAPAPPAREAQAALANGVSCDVRDGGVIVGEIQGKLNAKEILRSVLAQTHREQGEIPFAVDSGNTLYVAAGTDGDTLKQIPAVAALRGEAGTLQVAGNDWVVVARQHPASGLRFGIARPMSQAMKELRSATVFNFLAGFLLVGIATIGMIPLTGGMVKSVRQLEAGAARIAEGDLATRVPVRSRDEFGRLAESFNHMAGQLAEHQARLLEQERVHKEREIERRLLEAENGRKSQELEEARLFQLSLLPRQLPDYAGLELAVAMSTATEVGGDYYDFRNAENGDLLVAIGDATGHGAAAGTMVTVVKSLFMAAGDGASPAGFLRRATGLVHGMGLSRMAMALAVARISQRTLTISSAGMPPALHFRASSGEIDEIALPGMPLGARVDFPYAERRVELATGDVVLLMSDGFPELPNAAGEPLGYERARAIFAAAAPAPQPASEIVAALERAAADWSRADSAPPPAPSDDVTFLVLRAT